jgi:hypothetical protein
VTSRAKRLTVLASSDSYVLTWPLGRRDLRRISVEQRLPAVRTCMDHAYEDKLDGRLDEQMWTRKMRDWRDREKEI